MFRKIMIAGATIVALSSTAFAEEWIVVRGDGGCNVSNAKPGAGETQVGGVYATEAEAAAALANVAECESVNTDPDPSD